LQPLKPTPMMATAVNAVTAASSATNVLPKTDTRTGT
jgi:hypothetical protein